MSGLRTIVVGFGQVASGLGRDPRMARYFEYASHASVLAAHPAFDWQGVVDPNPTALDDARNNWSVAHCDPDLDRVAADVRPEIAVLATPPGNRADIISRLPDLKAVLVEKPLASSAAEVDGLIKTAAAKGRVLAPFQNRRYEPVFRKVQQVIDSGVLGRIVQIRMAVHAFARRWDWQTLKKFNGGSLTNTGPHFIDQALQLFGDATPDLIEAILGEGPAVPTVLDADATGFRGQTLDAVRGGLGRQPHRYRHPVVPRRNRYCLGRHAGRLSSTGRL